MNEKIGCDSLVCGHYKEFSVFSNCSEKCGILKMKETQVVLATAALASHDLLLAEREDVIILIYHLCNPEVATASQDARISEEGRRTYVVCILGRSSVETWNSKLELERPLVDNHGLDIVEKFDVAPEDGIDVLVVPA